VLLRLLNLLDQLAAVAALLKLVLSLAESACEVVLHLLHFKVARIVNQFHRDVIAVLVEE